MVETAQGGKPPIQAWLAPAVIVVAAPTFGAWLLFGPSPALSFADVDLDHGRHW